MSVDADRAEAQNVAFWDELAPVHRRAYDIASLRKGISAIDPIQKAELYPVAGKTIAHLQCHIGTDSLSLAMDGAIVTGVDFSPESIRIARELSTELGLNASFIEANVLDLRGKLEPGYDIVYTSKGVLCWISDIKAWGRSISYLLKPSGTFYLMEGHPYLPILAANLSGAPSPNCTYFSQGRPIFYEEESPDYADVAYIPRNKEYEWSWAIGDVLNTLIDCGLSIEFLHEYDSLYFNGMPGLEQNEIGFWRPADKAKRLPLTMTVRARKNRSPA
jgi:SAM-dependent methyltransferase